MTTQQIPNDWDQKSHQSWLDGKKNRAIKQMVDILNQSAGSKKKSHFLQLGYYLFFSNDLKSAFQILESAHRSYPDDCEILQNLALILGRRGDYHTAIIYFQKIIKIKPDNFVVYDGLAEMYYKISDFEKASEAGTRALTLKDKKVGNPDSKTSFPHCTPKQFCENKKNVISFSLWGHEKKYLYGALRNVLLAPDIYPGWEVWFYIDGTVPATFVSLIEQLGARTILQPNQSPVKEKLCWRFQVANNENVGYFLVRDSDAVIGMREYLTVQSWINSDKWFHVIRDWYTHTDLVIAGLWGGVAGILPDINLLLEQYIPTNVETPHIDQWFLRDELWSYIKTSALVHDRFFKPEGSSLLPAPQPHIPGSHIGCCEYNLARKYQEKVLHPWITGYAWGQP